MNDTEATTLLRALAPVGGLVSDINPMKRRRYVRALFEYLKQDGGYIPAWLRAEVEGMDAEMKKAIGAGRIRLIWLVKAAQLGLFGGAGPEFKPGVSVPRGGRRSPSRGQQSLPAQSVLGTTFVHGYDRTVHGHTVHVEGHEREVERKAWQAMSDSKLVENKKGAPQDHPGPIEYNRRYTEHKEQLHGMSPGDFKAEWSRLEAPAVRTSEPIRLTAARDVGQEVHGAATHHAVALPRATDSKENLRQQIRDLRTEAETLAGSLPPSAGRLLRADLPSDASIGNLNRTQDDLNEMIENLKGSIEEAKSKKAPPKPTPPEAKPKEYRYAAQNRPIGYANVPKGPLRADSSSHPVARHGVVVYDRPLTDEEVSGYELVPVVSRDEMIEEGVKKIQKYKERYLEYWNKGDKGPVRSALGGLMDKKIAEEIPDRDSFADAVMERFGRESAPAEVKESEKPPLPAKYTVKRDGKDVPIWHIDAHAWKAHQGIKTPWIAEISPMQYQGLSGREKARYDKQREEEWGTSAAGTQEYRRLIMEAHDAGLIDPKDPNLSHGGTFGTGARDTIFAELSARQERALEDRKKEMGKFNNLNESSDLKVGDRVYSLMRSGYVKVSKASRVSVRTVDSSGREYKEGKGALQRLHHDEFVDAVKAGAKTDEDLIQYGRVFNEAVEAGGSKEQAMATARAAIAGKA